jgi:hypothetical protein
MLMHEGKEVAILTHKEGWKVKDHNYSIENTGKYAGFSVRRTT